MILVATSERKGGMAVPRADFDDAGVEAETFDLPVIGIGKSLKRGNNDRARNMAAVFLADYIVELAIRHQVHSPISARVGNGSPCYDSSKRSVRTPASISLKASEAPYARCRLSCIADSG